MRLFKIHKSNIGSIDRIQFTGDDWVSTGKELEFFLRNQQEDVRFHGVGVHKIYIALKSIGVKPRILSKLRTGQVVSIKVGSKSTLIDIERWNLDLQIDRDEPLLAGLTIKGKIPSSPTSVVINDYRSAVFEAKELDYAQASKLSFMEAFLCSARIPSDGFRPGYTGGLMSSAADNSKVYENVISYDISSSYPWTAATSLLPYGSPSSVPLDKLANLKIVDGKIKLGENVGFIGLFEFKNLRRKDWVRIPMLRKRDERFCVNPEMDQAGLYRADQIRMVLTPDGLHSLALQYQWDDYTIEIMETHRLRYAPAGIRGFIAGAYEKKEHTTGIDRLRAKVAINTLIGLWGTDPFKKGEKLSFENGVWKSRYIHDLPKPWAEYAGVNTDGMSSGGRRVWDYRWAVYTIAAAQRRIIETEYFLYQAGLDVLYCDTDSIKMAGDKSTADYIFAELNRRTRQVNAELDMPETMGLWVDESAGYKRVVFRARKFYATEDADGNREAFISGMYKEDANAMVQSMTLEEIAAADEIQIHSSRPDFARIDGDAFEVNEQEISRELTFTYARNSLKIKSGDFYAEV